MDYSFVDRLLRLDPGKSALGVKHVTAFDAFLRRSPAGGLALRSCIVAEALGQTAAWCVMAANDFRFRPVAGVVGEVLVHDEAPLGETVLLDARIDSLTEESVVYHATATVRGKPVGELRDSLGPFLPMEEFSDPEQVRRQFRWIHRPGEPEELPPGIASEHPAEPPSPARMDRVLTWEPGREATGVKHVPVLLPFFADHFARKPVFPMSLLLETQLEFAHRFAAESWPGEGLVPRRIRNVKMNDFVQPGSSVVTRLAVRKREDRRAVLALRGEVDGKRVCLAEAEFAP